MNPRPWKILFFGLISILLLPLPGNSQPTEAEPLPRARVVRVSDPEAVRLMKFDAGRVQLLLNAALLQFTKTRDVPSAWRKLVLKTDRVGIKINTQPGPVMSSRPSLVEAILTGLESAGIPREHMIIFDRYTPQMEIAGYPVGPRKDGVIVAATTPDEGYDPNPSLNFSIPGKLIWGDLEFKKTAPSKENDEEISPDEDQLSTNSHFSKILTRRVDKIINVGVPITDPHLGIYGCELNMSLSLIDNFRRFQRPSYAREDSISQLATHPLIQKKCVLHILDALVAQYAGGPSFDPSYCWAPGSLYISHDPIALDSIALQIINERRPLAELPAIKEEAAYIQAIGEVGGGVSDPHRIDLEEVLLNSDLKNNALR